MFQVSIASGFLTLLFQQGEALSAVSSGSLSPSINLIHGNPGYLASSFLNHPAFQSFCSGSIPLICIPNAIDLSNISTWKHDAQALQSLAFGTSAGVASGQSGIRSGVHQVWLQSPGCRTQQHLVGNIDARKGLFRFVDAIRLCLDDGHFRSLPTDLVELSYLLYDSTGAAYAKHIDSFADASASDHKRCVSFLLYLGDDNEDLAWDCGRDGGALRIHGDTFAKATGQPIYTNEVDDFCSDITPQPGTIVLFDSATVPHEVVPTYRSRICVVGWLGMYATRFDEKNGKVPL